MHMLYHTVRGLMVADGSKAAGCWLWDGEIILDLLREPNVFTRVPTMWKREAKESVSEGTDGRNSQQAIVGLEDGRGSLAKNCWLPLKAGKARKWVLISLRPPELTHPCHHLDFSPLRHISGIWHLNLLYDPSCDIINLYYFEQLSMC